MKRILLVTAILMANVLTMSAAKKAVINRIEPTDWYVGMKNPQVQLMVYGQGIRDVASVTTDYPGVVGVKGWSIQDQVDKSIEGIGVES